ALPQAEQDGRHVVGAERSGEAIAPCRAKTASSAGSRRWRRRRERADETSAPLASHACLEREFRAAAVADPHVVAVRAPRPVDDAVVAADLMRQADAEARVGAADGALA